MSASASSFYPDRDAETGLREDRRRFLECATISLGLPTLCYASLRDPRVFETVVGRPMDACHWEQVTIQGYRPGIVTAGPGFPGIFDVADSSDSCVECVLIHGLSRFEQAMIAWYEWDEYRLHRLVLSDGRPAQAFLPCVAAIRREYGGFDIAPWAFDARQSHGVNRAVANAREWMIERPDDAALARAGCLAPAASPSGCQAAGQ